jgi:3D (Asp-Asp-Asp) domain-containing protein
VRSLFNQLSGSQVYIPGYGVAVIGDVGGGFPDGRAWIDLGYSDDDYQSWSGMVTVYFLAPAPATIPAGLE